jgi:glutathione S-transferase
MSGPDVMLSLPDSAVAYRNLLFHIENPVILDEMQFKTYWPLVDNVYSHRNTYITSSGQQIKYYECRLVKSRPSRSTRYKRLYHCLFRY